MQVRTRKKNKEEEDVGDEYLISDDDDIAVLTINPKTGKKQLEFAKVESISCMRARKKRARKRVTTRRAHIDDPTAKFTLRFWEQVDGKYAKGPRRPMYTQPLVANYKIQEYEAECVIGVVVMQPHVDPQTKVAVKTRGGDTMHACMPLDWKTANGVLKK